MSGVFVLPRETDKDDGLIAVGERLLLKLDGDTARVLGVAPLRTLREFGAAGRSFQGAVALEPLAWVFGAPKICEGARIWCRRNRAKVLVLVPSNAKRCRKMLQNGHKTAI